MGESVRVIYLGNCQGDAARLLQHLELAGYQVYLRSLETVEALHAAVQADDTWDLVFADCAACQDRMEALAERLEAAGHLPLLLIAENLPPEAATAAILAGARDVLAKENLANRLGLVAARELRNRKQYLALRQHLATIRQGEQEREATVRLLQRAEQALRENQRMLATLMSNLPGMAFRCRNDPDWTMEFISDGCLALTGYRPEDLCHNRTVAYGHIIHPQDRQNVWEQVQAALTRNRPYQIVYRIHAAGGQAKWVWEQGQGIYAPDGAILSIEGFTTDITHRVEAEELLRQSEERYRKLVEMSPDAIYIHRQGRLEFINPAGLKLFGASHPEQILGKPMLDLIHPDFREVVAQRIQAIHQRRTAAPLLVQKILRLDGSVGHTEAAATAFGHDDPLAVLVVARDLGDRQRAEEALREGTSLRELSHRILQSQEEERRRLSRELHDEAGQALTAIKLNTEVLAKRMPDNQPVLKRMAEDTSEVAAGLISEMRRIATGLRPVVLEDLGLLPTLRWYAKSIEIRYGLRVKLISRNVKGRLNQSFETTIYRIVQEALTNVVRHAQARHAVVKVTSGKSGLDLVVTDDGKGMDLGRIRQGTGLTGIRERAHLFAGTLTLESEAGAGTTLRIKFRTILETST